MYPLKKGKTTNQAHVGLPEGTFEEEHGRKGFYGKSAHLYHAHPPTGWIRFEGKLRPHCFDLNQLKPADLNDAEGMPVAFLGNMTFACLYRGARTRCRFTSAMPMATSCISSIAAGKNRNRFGPLDYEPGDYINIPRAVTYRVIPETHDNFFLIIQSKHEFEQPEKGCWASTRFTIRRQ
jgi:homogentisate 1,2-dioxygenase